MTTQHHHDQPHIAEIALTACFCGTELAHLEHDLRSRPGVTSVHIDRTRSVAHVGLDPARTDRAEVEAFLRQAGYDCTCRDCADS
ncbi:MAG: ATPase P, partial [Hamadaea sp.]|nr:ATPase P [Hamadaea sp.]